jgi:hypothetical protein
MCITSKNALIDLSQVRGPWSVVVGGLPSWVAVCCVLCVVRCSAQRSPSTSTSTSTRAACCFVLYANTGATAAAGGPLATGHRGSDLIR